MSDFDINVCGSYTNMVLSILDQFWQGEAIIASENSYMLPAGVLIRVFENTFPDAAPIKNNTTLKLAESINNTLRSLGFAPLDEPGSVMRYRCLGSRNHVAVAIAEEAATRKEKAA